MKQLRYIYPLLFLTTLVVSSCQKDEDPNYIRFGTTIYYPEEGEEPTRQTRGSSKGEDYKTTYSEFTGDFNLYGFYDNNKFIDGDALKATNGTNVKLISTGSTYKKLWPEQPDAVYQFYAFSPASLTVAIDANKIVSYNIPPDITNHQDLLFAKATATYGDEIALQFDHLLSRVTFGITKHPGYGGNQVRVKKVTLKGVKNVFTGEFTDTAFTGWTQEGDTKTDYYLDAVTGIAVSATPSPSTTVSIFNNQNLFLFPQDGLHNMSIELEITTPLGNDVIRGSLPPGEWEIGKWTHYHMEVNDGYVEITSTIEGWKPVNMGDIGI